jgi:hypothetical protein
MSNDNEKLEKAFGYDVFENQVPYTREPDGTYFAIHLDLVDKKMLHSINLSRDNRYSPQNGGSDVWTVTYLKTIHHNYFNLSEVIEEIVVCISYCPSKSGKKIVYRVEKRKEDENHGRASIRNIFQRRMYFC